MNEAKYSAHVELRQDGQRVVMYLNGLTKREAETLYRVLDRNYSHTTSSAELVRYGWEEAV
jgi:hypothetical protein